MKESKFTNENTPPAKWVRETLIEKDRRYSLVLVTNECSLAATKPISPSKRLESIHEENQF